jgi:cell division protein FtsW
MSAHTRSAHLPTALAGSGSASAATVAGGRLRRSLDPVLVASVASLLVLGLLVSYTASFPVGYAFFDDGGYFLKRQVAWIALGLAAAGVGVAVDYRTWRRYSGPAMVATVVALAALLVFGVARFGGSRWALASGSVQPAEMAKLTVILFIANWLASKRDQVRDFSLGVLPFGIITGSVCGLIMLQPDFSTGLLLAAVSTAMFFLAGAELRHLARAGSAATVLLVLVMFSAPYRIARWLTYLDPENDPTGGGYQVIQALRGIMRGGLTGVGLGNGQIKHILPVPHTDAVFAVLGEELGLVGCMGILILFVLIAWRGFRIAAGAPDQFGTLVAVGITSWVVMQALINVAVVTGVIPFTGMPLPWVSFGGSNLVACMAAMGILLNISGHIDHERARVYAGVDFRWRNRRSRLSRAHRARRLSDGDF